MKKLMLLFAVIAIIAGCTGDSEKGVIKHKEKPVDPSAEKKAEPGDKK